MNSKLKSILLIIVFIFSCFQKNEEEENLNYENLYFPPLHSNIWETKSLNDLNWNENELKPLLDFLEEKNTKSFIILHNGKIVVEEYFNSHNSNSFWYWASAGKTLTTAISGIAQDEDLLNINNKVSDYLGENWTSISLEKENLITCKNLLSMNSGIDNILGPDVSSSNLKYVADSGNRWAYHNVYVKMQNVIENATKSTWTNYFNTRLKDKIGMNGFWRTRNNFSLYWSNTRSMARFGLLIAANGKWKNTQIISKKFIIEATNTSQSINSSYGYLWWLNGKSSYHLPQSQIEFSGSLIPNAPNDLIAALGKNDQRIYIVPSKHLVIIRMGKAAGSSNFALSTFDKDIWNKINALID